ncbi:MAG TPA: DUF222 domain-containing protein, partial [Solirubrobacterales bacterium]|nr:DUF222 domain-containing protein [Solirubrobacterales bacterium]
GMWVLRGLFDGEGGAVIATGLDSLMGPPAPDDHRPGWQRRADAMVEVFKTGAPAAQLTVIAELETLRGRRGAPGGELRDGLMVPGATVQRIACDCERQEVRIGEDGINVEISGLTRVVPPKLRRALDVRDGGCRFPGCDRPAWMCDAHHLVWVENGGKTVLANLVLLCRRHHRYPHEKGWTLMWGESGELLALPP